MSLLWCNFFNVYVGYSIHEHYDSINFSGNIGGTFTYPPPLRGWARFLFHVSIASPDMSLYEWVRKNRPSDLKVQSPPLKVVRRRLSRRRRN